MTNIPVVSIIIPFFNPGVFFEEAVQSLFCQSFKEWELLLVDDGSTDGSTSFARHLAEQDPARVQYLEHDGHRNLGLSPTRNVGVRHAHGQYIAFLDADDVWFESKLQEQVSILEANPTVALVYGPDLWWYSWTNAPSDRNRDYLASLGAPASTIWAPPLLLIRTLQSKAQTPNPSNMMIRREVIDKVGGFEEQFVGFYAMVEDQAFLAKVCVRFPIFAAGASWYRYRQHPGSISLTYARAGKRRAAALHYCLWLNTYLKKAGIRQPELQEALRNRTRRTRYPALFGLLGFWQRVVIRMKSTGSR